MNHHAGENTMIPESDKLSRREAMKRVAAAAATISVLNWQTFGAGPVTAQPYGTDPLLNKNYQSGDFWPLTLNRPQKATTRTLADLILPADEKFPAASEVGTVEFIDEWISAPYPAQQADRAVVLEGLAWLDTEAGQRYGTQFAALAVDRQSALADDICYLERAQPKFNVAAKFFAKFRNLVAGGYYATQKGWKDIGFVGNVPTVTFAGPPRKVLEQLGLVGG